MQIVDELDRHIVGQKDAKRAVAVAIRNRWRRQHLAEEMRREVAPKNILMIGPTGVGKTEIARRLAKLTGAPFIKVEATKFTEVGYYGRDVESMIRELVENAISLVQRARTGKCEGRGSTSRRATTARSVGPHAEQSAMLAPIPPTRRSGSSGPGRKSRRCSSPEKWNSGKSRSLSNRRRCR